MKRADHKVCVRYTTTDLIRIFWSKGRRGWDMIQERLEKEMLERRERDERLRIVWSKGGRER